MTPLETLTLNTTQISPSVLPLILATVWMVRNDFAIYTVSAITLGQYACNQQNRNHQNDLIDKVLKDTMNPHGITKYFVEGEMHPYEEFNRTHSEKENLERFFKYYANRQKSIWFFDSLDAYLKLEHDLLNPHRDYHRHGFFFFIYTGRETDRLATIRIIFRRLYHLYVLNVDVMMMVGRHAYVYTYVPFTKRRCQSTQPRKLLTFRGIETNPNFTISKRLYSAKVANMQGCPLSIVTWTFPPFMFVDKNMKTGKFEALRGIEGSVINLLAQLMNFTIDYKELKSKEPGEIFPNGSATGAMNMILQHEANITAVAFIFSPERSAKLLPSESYLTLTFVLAMPLGRPLSPFERLYKPFRYIIWSCFSSSFLFGIICIYYVKYLGKSKLMSFIYGQGNRLPFTNLLSTLFGGVAEGQLPQRNFARYILTVWLLYTFVLRSAYSGALFQILQDGSGKNNLKTLDEVVAHNYTIYASAIMESVLKFAQPRGDIRHYDHVNSLDKLLETISEPNSRHKIALCLYDVTVKYYNQMNPTRRVQILKQPIMSAPIIFYMPRHSYLRLHTMGLILRMVQSGLIKRFVKFNIYDSSKDEKRRSEYIALSMDVLMGLYWLYGFLLAICGLVFAMEILTKRCRRAKKVIDFFNI
ncbi:uncharacterized protein isoform X2 [Musca autumnalis]|uniref:uncharacterized protein isoform X2 n=1 Tax=Musca autumnalis TaxID=221902 RepID=UPI003CE7E34A